LGEVTRARRNYEAEYGNNVACYECVLIWVRRGEELRKQFIEEEAAMIAAKT
jgi:hypothetical protein